MEVDLINDWKRIESSHASSSGCGSEVLVGCSNSTMYARRPQWAVVFPAGQVLVVEVRGEGRECPSGK